jgi:Tfp pilus assembly protein PilX
MSTWEYRLRDAERRERRRRRAGQILVVVLMALATIGLGTVVAAAIVLLS